MSRIQSPYVVGEGDISVWHAWGDGLPVAGPTLRHRELASGFRTGLRISQVPAADGVPSSFGDWRVHGSGDPRGVSWMIEISSAFGAIWDDGAQVASMVSPGAPVVIVVRFRDRSRPDLWRVLQFHDAVLMPTDTGDESQRMMRSVRFSAGWMDEYKSGVMPELAPRVRGIIEWRHLGRVVRAWEYDPIADSWDEDQENVVTVDGEPLKYVDLDIYGEGAELAMLAAVTGSGTLAGDPAAVIGWKDVKVFEADQDGLRVSPGWAIEADGIAEPLLIPESGRHWEHPRVIIRVMGRTYATICAGVVAMPSLSMEDPGEQIDMPVRMGALRLFPAGGWIW